MYNDFSYYIYLAKSSVYFMDFGHILFPITDKYK